jgi:DNA-binding transcriptional ArsR family regulator
MIDLNPAPVRPRSQDVAPELAMFLKLLADPTRRRIFLLLMQGETCNCELTELLGLPQNLVSHHLRALKQAGLVRSRRDARDARWVYYWIDRAMLEVVTDAFQALFSPLALQDRAPQCGPASARCDS